MPSLNKDKKEKYYHLRYNTMQFVKNQQIFPRNNLPPSSRFENKPKKKAALSRQQAYFVCCPLHSSVGTAHINSGAGHSQNSRFHLLGNGRINTFPQQRILTEIP
jgi:hypothetical protein